MSDSDHGAVKKKTENSDTPDNSAAEQWSKGDALSKDSGKPPIAKSSDDNSEK